MRKKTKKVTMNTIESKINLQIEEGYINGK